MPQSVKEGPMSSNAQEHQGSFILESRKGQETSISIVYWLVGLCTTAGTLGQFNSKKGN